ncbi:hypothetical protein L1X07_12630 [Acinetobacter baumannii]|nr:hypothetical protein [Acinetobacter baumannii]MCF4272980.1 hypothetical protein [Acinetobacter baumannii]MCF4290734.1 hypothetical protein [Acinetobacter baumannii]MCF4301714.1 hypothetical protein [Acinetobacter baumannii]MCF4320200.1 hypothetical protein [Acinetobacter baumannii]
MQSIVKHIFRHYLVALLCLGIFILSYFVGMVFGKLLFKNMNAVEIGSIFTALAVNFYLSLLLCTFTFVGQFFFNSLKKIADTPFQNLLILLTGSFWMVATRTPEVITNNIPLYNFNISLITLFAFMLFISNSKFIKAFISKQE